MLQTINQAYLGRCSCCKSVYRVENRSDMTLRCERCSPVSFYGGKVYHGHRAHIIWKRIEGYFSDHKCDVRCTHAKGHKCECSCGGKNHGSAWGGVASIAG